MPNDVDECNPARPALGGVHPIPRPRICNRISIAAIPDIKTVERMKSDRQPDPKQLKKEHKRKIPKKAYLPRVSVGPADGGGVRNQNMFDQECAYGHNARKRMQPAQQKRCTLAGTQRSYTLYPTFPYR